jgi:hypothetical protein
MTTDGNGGAIDSTVRDRVMRQIEAFEQALDDAEQNPSSANQDKLHKAADELMRAVAGVLLELGKQP